MQGSERRRTRPRQTLIETAFVSSTRSSSRRMLPRPPNRDKDTELFSPESEQGSSLTPPRTQESEAEDEFSFMEHTQHLVDVMEERLKQV